jgi:hypothetical protein
MIRRVSVPWPDRRAFRDHPDGRIRILAVSDEPDPALRDERTRASLGRIDLVIGCGDLEPDELAFVGDAFLAPIAYVRGNHDHGAGWAAHRDRVPEPLADAAVREENGLRLAGLSWPDGRGSEGRRNETNAWFQALRLALRTLLDGRPVLVVSHAPPHGAGDVATDPFHAGFPAYAWLLHRLRPPLWLHGHTPPAAKDKRSCVIESTTCTNVTGAMLIELTLSADRSDERPAEARRDA